MTEEQRTLEGLVVTSRDALKDAIREVLREEGVVGTVRRAGEHWDHAYKGDEFWLEFRAHVVALLQSNVAVGYRDLDQDGYFVKKAALREVKQWLRAIDAHLVPNRPRGADGLDLVTFTLGPRTGRYLTARPWLHCAIATVADRHGRRDPKLIQRVRLRYIAAVPCERCRGRPAAVSHPRPQEGAKETDSVRVTNGDGREALEEVLHAAGSQSREGVGD